MKKKQRIAFFILSGVALFWGVSFIHLYNDRNQTGFIESNAGIIYKDENLNQKYGMQKINDKTYYFDPNTGYLDSGFHTIKNKTYYFNENGKLYSGLKKINKNIYFFNKDGSIVKNTFKKIQRDNQKQIVYFNESGKINKKTTLNIDNIQYTFDTQGNLQYDIDYLKNQTEKIASAYGGKTSVYFKDLTNNQLFSLNDTTYYPCCMIKVPALAAVFQAIEQGKFSYDDYKFYIDNMIIVSDNTSYNRLMKLIGDGNGQAGLQKVNQICNAVGMKNTQLNHGLRPGEDYFGNNTPNVSSAKDSAILFEALYNGNVISKESSAQMIELLKKCEDYDGIYRGIPHSIPYAHKTGELSNIYNDGGIVYLPNRNYILVVYTQDSSYKYELMNEISSFIYSYQKTFAN